MAGWSKRKAIVLTGGASGAQTSFQLKLTVTFDGDMQSDFDDLRFTQADGTTLIDAWLETKTDDTSATVWTKFPTTPANTVEQTYYMYYGNSGVVSDWDIGATMLFGDDFPGSSLDTAKWTSAISTGCSVSVTGGELLLDAPTSAANDTHAYIASNSFTFQKGVIEIRSKSTATYYMHSSCGSDTNCFAGTNKKLASGYYFMGYMPTSHRIRRIDAACSSVEIASGVDGGAWTSYQNHKHIICDDASNNIRKYIDGVLKNQVTDNIYLTNDKKISLSQSEYSNRGGLSTIDWIFVRKYAANPPTYGFGSEENAPSGNSCWYWQLLKRRN